MLDERLVRAINSTRCFALVGSGPSCEMGYPSWKALAEQVAQTVLDKNASADRSTYKKYLDDAKYPELFRQAEVDLGNRQILIELLRTLMVSRVHEKGQGCLYEFLSNWPFACYLTTNYDDELKEHLAKLDEHFSVIRNRKHDFYSIRDGASRLIQKLHSDLDHPSEVVITSEDYRRLYIEADGAYFKDKLRQVLEMFDVFIVGHSLADPDINHILQLARTTASPQHPIFMMASGFTRGEEREYLEKYNIVLVQYENADGTHANLRRLLATADRFIVPRRSRIDSPVAPPRPREEVDAAMSLFLYRRLQEADATAGMESIVLASLALGEAHTLDALLRCPLIGRFSSAPDFSESLKAVLKELEDVELVRRENDQYIISAQGREKVEQLQAVRSTERDQSFGQFRLDLKAAYPCATEEQLEQCEEFGANAIVASFERRGLTIANQVFAGQTPSPDELSDLFGYVTNVAAGLGSPKLRGAFLDAMHRFLIEPSDPQKNYLASVSQGYFLYHYLGLDPTCAKVRRDVFEHTMWICDASVLLPLLAVGCSSHEYSVEMFRMLSDSQAAVWTTPRLLDEVWEHLQWAMGFVSNHGVDSPEFLHSALVRGSYKQNLFLDGFIRLSAEGRVVNFADYLQLVSPKGNDRTDFENYLSSYGIAILNPPEIDGFSQEDWGDIEEAKAKIKGEREKRGTYRTPFQVEAEAEIWVLVKNIRSGKYSITGVAVGAPAEQVYFVSQSKVLDLIDEADTVTTWGSEAVYRYLSVLPGNVVSPDLLQQCMTHEYFYAGVSFIDKPRYLRFFGPSIEAAKLSFEQEKAKYIQAVEEEHATQLDEAFERTPDLEKPFFVAQMGWRVAEASQRAEELAKKRAKEADARVKELETERDAAWKLRDKRRSRDEEARLRNLQDLKKVRKRKRQAKKRARKKKK